MSKVAHPVRLLFIIYVCSLFLLTYLLSMKVEPVKNAVSTQRLSFAEILNESIKGAGKAVTNWFIVLSCVVILHLLFLIALKLISEIKAKELILFFVITIPVVLIGVWLFSLLSFEFFGYYVIALTVSIVSFLLLRISGHWNS